MDFLPVGRIIDPARDPFASTGAHGDFRIIPMYGDQRGQHIDPATRPELLARIFAGEGDNRRPITAYPMTSGFGPRQAPAPGASTFHKGLDYAIPMGTPLSIQGATEYYSQNGVGVAKITDAQGRPYEIELFHTDPGQFVQASAPQIAVVPEAAAPQEVAPQGIAPAPVLRNETGQKIKQETQRKPEHLELGKDDRVAMMLRGGLSTQGSEAAALQNMQRGLYQVLSQLQNRESEEARTRLALDKAAQQAAEAFSGGQSVI